MSLEINTDDFWKELDQRVLDARTGRKLFIEEITKLREQVVAQAAVIEKLKSALIKFGLHKLSCDYVEQHRGGRFEGSDGVCDCGFSDALAIPTDSTRILDEVRRAERERVYQVADNAYATEHVLLAIRAME